MAERIAQKQKTRQDLLVGARVLLSRGETVTVTAAAREVGVSKATAYRYYSDPALLAAEAGLDYKLKSYEEIVEGCETLRETLVAINLHFFDLAIENENAFRSYLGLFLQASTGLQMEPPERGARRIRAYTRALREAEADLSEVRTTTLCAALSMGTGPEAMVSLLDVAKLPVDKARAVVAENASALIDRFVGADF